jgi:hypothetical protein
MLPLQQGSIGIWDCHEQYWTPLLLLDPPSSRKRAPWNLSRYIFSPRFSPEAEEQNETNRVLMYVPPRWKLASNIGNVRNVKSFDAKEAHLLLFEAKRSASSARRFGKSPNLKMQLPLRFVVYHLVLDYVNLFFSSKQNTVSDLGIAILSWDPQFDTATVYHSRGIKQMTQDQLKESILLS